MSKELIVHIVVPLTMIVIILCVVNTINTIMINTSFVETIYVPLSIWKHLLFFGALGLFIFLFVPFSCNGIPYIYWVIRFFEKEEKK